MIDSSKRMPDFDTYGRVLLLFVRLLHKYVVHSLNGHEPVEQYSRWFLTSERQFEKTNVSPFA